MRSLTLLTLALTLSFSSLARSYQVARVHGVIIKISGDKVRVQDDKNQIFSVDRNKAYPIGSQIGDDVVIYQKVRFKSSHNENTTSFFIKHRRTPMIKAIRKFFVSYEKKMGYKYKKKKKYTFYDRFQSLFSIEEAHAQASVGDICYVGGRKSKILPNNKNVSCEIPKGFTCGDNNEGFRCSPSIFYKKEVSKTDIYLKNILHIDEETKDKGFCVKHDGSNITRRCYNASLKAFGSESKADEFEQRERIIENLYANLDEDQEAIDEELEGMVNDIDELCEDKEGADRNCDDFVADIEEIENDLLGWAEAKKTQDEADELEIRADEVKKMQAKMQEYFKKNGQNYPAQAQQPIYTHPQNGGTQPVGYQVMLGNQMRGHNPLMAQMAMMGQQQPMVFIIVPNQAQGGRVDNKFIQGLIDALGANSPTQKKKTKDSNTTDSNNGDDDVKKPSKPEITLSSFSYANKLENCKVYEAELCLVKQENGSFKNYKNVSGNYEEFEFEAEYNETNGTIELDGRSFLIADLEEKDPSLKWECQVAPGETMENSGNSCMASKVSCDVYDEDNTLVIDNKSGFLSKQHAQAFGADGGTMTYKFNSYTKMGSVSPALPTSISSESESAANDGLMIEGSEPQEFLQERHPPLFYSPCEDFEEAKDNEMLKVRADNKECTKVASYPPTPCEHGNCPEETITVCKTDVSCQVEYKNAFNKLISDQTMEVTLDCTCELGNPEAVDIASCIESSQESIIRGTGKNQPNNSSQQ